MSLINAAQKNLSLKNKTHTYYALAFENNIRIPFTSYFRLRTTMYLLSFFSLTKKKKKKEKVRTKDEGFVHSFFCLLFIIVNTSQINK